MWDADYDHQKQKQKTKKGKHSLSCMMLNNDSERQNTAFSCNDNNYISKALNPSISDLHQAQRAAHVQLKPNMCKENTNDDVRTFYRAFDTVLLKKRRRRKKGLNE